MAVDQEMLELEHAHRLLAEKRAAKRAAEHRRQGCAYIFYPATTLATSSASQIPLGTPCIYCHRPYQGSQRSAA